MSETPPVSRYDNLALEFAEMKSAFDQAEKWRASQIVRNRARAFTYAVLMFVNIALVVTAVLFANYLNSRRAITENRNLQIIERLDRDEYGACQSLQNVPGDSASDARETLQCDRVLQGPPIMIPSS